MWKNTHCVFLEKLSSRKAVQAKYYVKYRNSNRVNK